MLRSSFFPAFQAATNWTDYAYILVWPPHGGFHPRHFLPPGLLVGSRSEKATFPSAIKQEKIFPVPEKVTIGAPFF
ncbi:hypothetical protein [Hymenobacter daeguensis]